MSRVVMLLSNPFIHDARVYREATSLTRQGHDVTIYAWDRDGAHPPREEKNGIHVERVHVAAGYGRGALSLGGFAGFGLAAMRRASARPFDIVHSHDLDTMPFGYLLARLRGKPVIFDAHEPYSLYQRFHGVFRGILQQIESYMLRHADHVITVTPGMVDWLRTRGARRVTLVANYPDDLFYSDIAPKPRPDSAPLVLGWIGSLKPGNQLELIVDGVTEYNARHPDAPMGLLFVGPVAPAYKERLLERGHALKEHLQIIGPVPYQEVPRYYQLLDMSIMVDADVPQKRLALNLKLYESMAMGVPIIVQPSGGAKDVVTAAGAGLVLPDCHSESIANALEALASDPLVRSTMGRNGWRAVRERYNWGVSEQALFRVYDSLLGNAAPATTQTTRGEKRPA